MSEVLVAVLRIVVAVLFALGCLGLGSALAVLVYGAREQWRSW